MNKKEKKQFKEKLLETMAQVKTDIEKLEELTQPIPPENAIGRITRMDAINNKSVNEANLRRARVKLSRLELSLRKMDSPSFGKCIVCGKTIQTGRLMFLPESTKCVRCAG